MAGVSPHASFDGHAAAPDSFPSESAAAEWPSARASAHAAFDDRGVMWQGQCIEHDVPLAPRTTLGVGGSARALVQAESLDDVERALEAANDHRWPILVLGGGSNLLVSDAGFRGLVVSLRARRVELTDEGRVRAEAGASWDALVERTVASNLAGIECLSGIPGCVGAAPIQNIGAYGQELSDRLRAVEVIDVRTGAVDLWPASALDLGYRDSRLKRDPGAWIVWAAHLALEPDGPACVRYRDLVQRLAPTASVADVRRTVLDVRRGKSMVWSPDDPNRRSAGSFFTNPVVDSATADALEHRLPGPMPRHPARDGVKLSAAWLIERAGFQRGWGEGPAGLSTRHVLAIVNRGGATAQDILRVARTIRKRVRDRLGITLVPEPVFVGFDEPVATLLDG